MAVSELATALTGVLDAATPPVTLISKALLWSCKWIVV